MMKYLLLLIAGWTLLTPAIAQRGQPFVVGIGAESDSLTVMITVGQPYIGNSFGFATMIDGSIDSLLYYTIGDIPNITFNPGVQTRFEISWKDHNNARYSYRPISLSDTVLDISLITAESKAVFEYNPENDIMESFQLEFMAVKQNDTAKQTVTFNPVYILPPDYKTLAYRFQSSLQDTVIIYRSENNDTVSIIGYDIIFENGSINYGVLEYNEGSTLKQLSVYATNILVRDVVKLPGCELKVYCESLSFENDAACFDIQPTDALTSNNGKDSKNMEIYAKNFSAKGSLYRFWLRGGKGASEEIEGPLATGGGNAGNFITNLDVSKYVNLEGGYVGDLNGHTPLGSKGKDGQFIREASLYGWLHPNFIRFALKGTKEDYVHGLEEKVFAACQKYIQILDAYKKSSEYDTINLDLAQLYDAFSVINEKLIGGYDYFGNSKNWAPLLSFEANMDMYNNEIDYAIRVLYLQSWITGIGSDLKKKKEGANKLIEKNLERIEELRASYNTARTEYPNYLDSYIYDSKKMDELNILFNKKIDSLYTRAKNIVAKKNHWKNVLYDIGNYCSYVPGMNHYGLLFKTIAQIDYNEPFTSENLDLAKDAFTKGLADFTTKSEIVAGYYSGDKDAMAEGGKELLKVSMDNLSAEERKKNQDIKNQLVMPNEEVEAKFNQLKAECPQVDGLADSLEIVSHNKAISWNNLAYAISCLNNTSGEINQLLTSVNALNNVVAYNTNFDARAVSVLNEMKTNAWGSLLKHQYYMARAYQYRFLEPYTKEIDMEGLFYKIDSIAQKGTDDSYYTNFNALKVLFEKPLMEMTEELYDNFNAGISYGSNHDVYYVLSKEELSTLNEKQELTINLWESGIINKEYFDVRITNFSINDTSIKVWSDIIVENTRLTVNMEHSGKSKFIDPKTGLHYMFDQYSAKSINAGITSPINWGLVYNFSNKDVSQINRSLKQESLIKHLLGNNKSDENVFAFTFPSAWADIKVRTSVDGSQTNFKYKINSLTLKFNIDYKINNGLFNLLVQTNKGLKPIILCNTADVNGFTHGRGNFTRTYKPNKNIEFTAPPTYGNYAFVRWLRTDIANNHTDSLYSNKIQINSNLYKWITAEYELAIPQLELPDTIFADYTAQSIQFNIQNARYCDNISMNWMITENCEWLSLTGEEEGVENGTSTIQLTENTGDRRMSKIEICSPNAIEPFVNIVVIQSSIAVGNETDKLVNAKSKITLHPNPASNEVTVSIEGSITPQKVSYAINDMQGKIIENKSNVILSGSSQLKIDIGHVNNGIYILVLTLENGELIREKLEVHK